MNQTGSFFAFAGVHLPPPIALVGTVCFVVYLFRRDSGEQRNVSSAVWIPLLWMLAGSSRSISEWAGIIGLPVGGPAPLEEGSPLDACFYIFLILSGLYVLNQRPINLSEVLRRNGWLMVFLLYCFIAITWSDEPFVAFKRWIKILGHPIMVLILFTEPDPEEALIRLMKRASYIIIPFSVLFIKYYPELGRTFDPWSGLPTNRGIAQTKNMLGADLLILGLFVFYQFLNTWSEPRSKWRRKELVVIGIFGLMILWLFKQAQSSTSLVCCTLGILIIVLLGRPWLNRGRLGTYAVVVASVLLIGEWSFGLSSYVIQFLHKDPTLTDRTVLWKDLLALKTNPIIGVGFESFWMGERLLKLHEGRAWQPNEAHNGYLETYLNLGLIGLGIMIAWIIATFRKSQWELLHNSFNFGRFRLGFLAAVVLYNWTEAPFRAVSPMWFVFYIIALDYPKATFEPITEESEVVDPHELSEIAYLK